jgi:A/G-specific adenine glycosylase
MLQQTRVETVIGYWQRFLARFPDVRALARASEADVLAAWSGLGYYRRARALRDAAQAIVARHDGEFPRDAEAVRALPGIGPYTTGAVLSIAFDQPEALVDGNVVRVLSRWYAHDVELTVAQRWAWDVARDLVPTPRGAGEWNQALMELGATVCTPLAPRCDTCPVAEHCLARARNLVARIPRPKKRPEPIDVELVAWVVERKGALLLEQRPESGRMAGLWQLPTVQTAPARPELFPAESSLKLEPGPELGLVRHAITRHRIRLVLQKGRLSTSKLPSRARWVAPEELAQLALTGMARKALAVAWGIEVGPQTE